MFTRTEVKPILSYSESTTTEFPSGSSLNQPKGSKNRSSSDPSAGFFVASVVVAGVVVVVASVVFVVLRFNSN
jgi:hypothetical protein